MPDETIDADVRFGRHVMLTCKTIVFGAAVVALLDVLRGEWWQSLILMWFQCGAVSVMIQVVTDSGYIRLAPRFDAVFSYSLSIIAGPISLIRTLLDLV